MSNILRGPEHACLKSVHENALDYWRYLAESSLVSVKESDELFLVDFNLTREQSPFTPSGIVKTNLKPEKVDETIEEVIEYYQSRNTSFWWEVFPSSKPRNLNKYLEAHNFKATDSTPMMATELHKLIDDRPKPEGITIKSVSDEDAMRTYGDVWCRGYPMPKPLADHFTETVIDIGLDSKQAKYYLAYIDDTPVATSMLFLGAGVAGLYSVTVLPEARGRGLGTEMSLIPLREAREMGYGIGVLDATQKGYRIYERLGFINYGTPTLYILQDPDQKEFDNKVKDFINTPRN